MKNLIIVFLIYRGMADAQIKDYPIQPVTFTSVKLNDLFGCPVSKLTAR